MAHIGEKSRLVLASRFELFVCFQRRQGLDAITDEGEVNRSVTNLVAKFLYEESLKVRLVVDDQNLCGHAALPTRISISFRSSGKSIGLVNRASAPPSKT